MLVFFQATHAISWYTECQPSRLATILLSLVRLCGKKLEGLCNIHVVSSVMGLQGEVVFPVRFEGVFQEVCSEDGEICFLRFVLLWVAE
jgi:hypothetical protein